MKHIILGAGGPIGTVLAKELIANDEKVKLVSRSGHSMPPAESAKADLTNFEEVKNAVEENSIVYLTAGLKYDLKVWQANWMNIMRNTVEACKAKNSKLIFFDNIYALGKVNGKMKEDSPINPCSKKGEVRAKLLEYLQSEIKNKNLNIMIARSADFYGPYASASSIPDILVIDKLLKGKKPQWMVNPNSKHSFTYTEDCGKALYLLAKDENAFNQTWHLPTASPSITGKQFIEIAAQKMGVQAKYMTLSKWMIKLAGLFDKTLSEIYEMLYQSEYDYEFDSSKFETYFSFKPIPYEEGIVRTIDFFKKTNN